MELGLNVDKRKEFIINFAYMTLWIFIIFIIFKVVLTYLLPFFIGVIISCLVQKPALLISKKIKINKELCAAILSVVFFMITILILAVLIWFLCVKSLDLFDMVSKHFKDNNIKSFNLEFEKNLKVKNLKYAEMLSEIFKNFISVLSQKIGDIISSNVTKIFKKIPLLFVSSIVTVVATCYISKDFDNIKKFLCGMIKNERLTVITEIKNITFNCFLKFFISYFLIFLLTFVELCVGFVILGVNKVIITAIIISLFDLLPLLGTGTILLPWAIISIFKNMYFKGVGLVLLYLLIVMVRNYFEPKIIGKQIEIHPLFMLIFIFLGFKIGGIGGMLVLPLVLTVAFTYYRQKYIV